MLGVWEVEATSGIPLRALVPVRRYPSVVAEDEGQVEEVPGHERGSSLVVAKGSATITATTDGVSGNASVTVVAELQEEVGE